MSESPIETEETEEPRTNSRKREITATVTAAVVAIVMTGIATGLIDKLSKKVRDSIAPPAEKDEEEN